VIRRLLERWLGHDRLLVAYEAQRAELADVRRRSQAQADALTSLADKHLKLQAVQRGTSQRLARQRTQLNGLVTAYTRALVELQWAQFQLDQIGDEPIDCSKRIRLVTSEHAWEVADILAKRFGRPMYAHECPKCPVNLVTRGNYWHVTKKPNAPRRIAAEGRSANPGR